MTLMDMVRCKYCGERFLQDENIQTAICDRCMDAYECEDNRHGG